MVRGRYFSIQCRIFEVTHASRIWKGTLADTEATRERLILEMSSKLVVDNLKDWDTFIEPYKAICAAEDKIAKEDTLSENRRKRCEGCSAIPCGKCKYITDNYCNAHDCESLKSKVKLAGGRIDSHVERCFLCNDYQKELRLHLKGKEDLQLVPDCDNCADCIQRVDTGKTDWLVLKDVPFNGYPTSVCIEYVVYEPNDYHRAECRRPFYAGIQSRRDSNFTIRLVTACTTGILARSYMKKELAEWFDVSPSYLTNLIKRETAAVAKKKVELRATSHVGRTKSVKGSLADMECKMFFYIPVEDETKGMEFIGAYSAKELHYLKRLQHETIPTICKRRDVRLTHDQLFAMAYDYAAEEGRSLIFATVFAFIMVMADMEASRHTDSLRDRLYSTILDDMKIQASDTVQYGLKPVDVIDSILDSAKMLLRLLAEEEQDSNLANSTKNLIRYIESRKDRWEDEWNRCWQDMAVESEHIAHVLELSCEQLAVISNSNSMPDMSFEEVRDHILFGNQAVIPYVVDKQSNTVKPVFTEEGDIDLSRITSIGLSCACIECWHKNGYREYSPTCKVLRYGSVNAGNNSQGGSHICQGQCREIEFK